MPEKVEDGINLDLIKLFLDLDLSVLGWPTDEYSDYALRVRYEYQHYPDEDFISGRQKVLEHLGNKDKPIYFTDFFKQKFEDQARQNMQEEKDML